jgi:flagellar biosynthesis protein FliQ
MLIPIFRHANIVLDTLMNGRKLRRRSVGILLLLAAVALIASQSVGVSASTNYGDTNIEPLTSTLIQQYVVAMTKITVTNPVVMQSVSLYLQYTGSDGSQCLKFGIYADAGNDIGPLGSSLVAATRKGYCFQITESFGPAWETWQLAPSDYLTISTPGVYWLCTLASQAYGTIFHYTYTGAYGGEYLYNYGYYSYSFPASYPLGFPQINFPHDSYAQNTPIPSVSGPHYPSPLNFTISEYNAPFSFYMTGT